jgi:Lon protease-like protein
MNLAATPTLRPADLDALPLFPLPQVVLFPGTALPLHVFEPRYRALAEYCLESGSALALPQIRPGHEAEHLGAPPLLRVAGVGAIVHHERLPENRIGLVLRGLGRVEIVEEHPTTAAYRTARVILLGEPLPDPARASADMAAIRDCLRLLARRVPNLSDALLSAVNSVDDPGIVADRLASVLFRAPTQRQALLECVDVNVRLRKVVERLGGLAAGTVRPSDGVN